MIQVDIRNCFNNNLIIYTAQIDSRFEDAPRSKQLGQAVLQAVKNGVSLNYADLSYANLRNKDLRNANFWKADLTGADLSNTDLIGAKLNFVKGVLPLWYSNGLQVLGWWLHGTPMITNEEGVSMSLSEAYDYASDGSFDSASFGSPDKELMAALEYFKRITAIRAEAG